MQFLFDNRDERNMEIEVIDMNVRMMWDRLVLRENRDADRFRSYLYQRHRDLVADYISYMEDNSDTRDIAPVNTDAAFVLDPKVLTDTSSQNRTNSPHWQPLLTDTRLVIMLELLLLLLASHLWH